MAAAVLTASAIRHTSAWTLSGAWNDLRAMRVERETVRRIIEDSVLWSLSIPDTVVPSLGVLASSVPLATVVTSEVAAAHGAYWDSGIEWTLTDCAALAAEPVWPAATPPAAMLATGGVTRAHIDALTRGTRWHQSSVAISLARTRDGATQPWQGSVSLYRVPATEFAAIQFDDQGAEGGAFPVSAWGASVSGRVLDCLEPLRTPDDEARIGRAPARIAAARRLAYAFSPGSPLRNALYNQASANGGLVDFVAGTGPLPNGVSTNAAQEAVIDAASLSVTVIFVRGAASVTVTGDADALAGPARSPVFVWIEDAAAAPVLSGGNYRPLLAASTTSWTFDAGTGGAVWRGYAATPGVITVSGHEIRGGVACRRIAASGASGSVLWDDAIAASLSTMAPRLLAAETILSRL